jgi:hypothetical protein
MNFNVAKIKKEFRVCSELLKEMLKFLKKGGRVTNDANSDIPALLKTFQEIIDQNNINKMDKFDENEYQVFEILGSEKDSIAKYDNILRLLAHFGRLERGVFADMLVYRDGNSNIKDKLIDEVKSLVVYFTPTTLKFKSVSEWMVKMYQRTDLWSLFGSELSQESDRLFEQHH